MGENTYAHLKQINIYFNTKHCTILFDVETTN